METIIKKLKKIHELSIRGEAGEAESAKMRLDIMLKKHGLTIDDIKNEKTHQYKFTYVTVHERSIMINCIATVLDNPQQSYSYRKDKKKEIFVEMTEFQYQECLDYIDFHIKQFRKELKAKMKALVAAYLNKHNIFPESSEPGESTLSEEEMEELLRAYRGLEDKSYAKKLKA